MELGYCTPNTCTPVAVGPGEEHQSNDPLPGPPPCCSPSTSLGSAYESDMPSTKSRSHGRLRARNSASCFIAHGGSGLWYYFSHDLAFDIITQKPSQTAVDVACNDRNAGIGPVSARTTPASTSRAAWAEKLPRKFAHLWNSVRVLSFVVQCGFQMACASVQGGTVCLGIQCGPCTALTPTLVECVQGSECSLPIVIIQPSACL